MALNINKDKDVKVEATAKAAPAAEVKAAPAAAAPAAAPDGTVYGEDRDKLEFLNPLGDPSNADTTRIKLEGGREDKKVTSTIVGYKFKVLADMEVPDCGTNIGLKNDPMNFENIDKWRAVKAGEVIMLTPFESALLLSQPRFNGGCSGGEKAVTCVYQTPSQKSKAGGASTVASVTQKTPRVSLRAATGSIKDFDIEDVLISEDVVTNGIKRKKRTIKPGFEKWEPLTMVTSRAGAGGSRGTKEAKNVANQNAQAFLSYVNSRKA